MWGELLFLLICLIAIMLPMIIIGVISMMYEEKVWKNTPPRKPFDPFAVYEHWRFNRMIRKVRCEIIKYELFGDDE
jgi:hypothetical protein